MFEILGGDLAGRIGRLETNHGRISTPAFVPVIHPVKQSIPAADIRRMGFEMVITNAYITRRNYPDTKDTIHEIIGYDGPVMTDSGGYQVLEYGRLDVSHREMAEFETRIMTDIAIPLDRPTGFRASRRDAEDSVRHTLEVSKDTLESSQENGQIWVGPIQGGTHLDLVQDSARALVKYGYRMLALGSPVEYMESYRFAALARMIVAARRAAPPSVPLHLFGAGHPLTIPLAVALGCDTFDSASYMLYAKHGRYITEDRTRHLEDIREFLCECAICQSHTPEDIRGMETEEKTEMLARHNLAAIGMETRRVRDAMEDGRLWEYVMKKSRAHPSLYEANRVLCGNTDLLRGNTPAFKSGAAFFFSKDDQYRPEAAAFREMVQRFVTEKKILAVIPGTMTNPAYLSEEYAVLRRLFKDPDSVQYCTANPYLGIIPLELSDLYPAAHCMIADVPQNPADFAEAAASWDAFLERNGFDEIHVDGQSAFLRYLLERAPEGIRRGFLETKRKKES